MATKIQRTETGYQAGNIEAHIGELAPREAQLLVLKANGETDKEIAKALGIKPKSLDPRKANIFYKLGVNRCTAAIAVAFQRGLLTHHMLLAATLSTTLNGYFSSSEFVPPRMPQRPAQIVRIYRNAREQLL